MNDVVIVPAKFEDIPQIAKVTAESWKAAYSGIVAKEYLESLEPSRWTERLERSFEDKTVQVLMAMKEKEAIGISGFGKSRFDNFSDDGEIVSMYFLPAFIGKGHGHQLMKEVMSELSSLGYPSVILSVFTANSRAIDFYSSWGFKVVETGLMLDLGGVEYEYQLMRRSLP